MLLLLIKIQCTRTIDLYSAAVLFYKLKQGLFLVSISALHDKMHTC